MQDLEILQICIFSIDVELDSGHRDIEVDAIKDLAESRAVFPSRVSDYHAGQELRPEGHCAGEGSNLPSSALFNFGNVQLEKVVEP